MLLWWLSLDVSTEGSCFPLWRETPLKEHGDQAARQEVLSYIPPWTEWYAGVKTSPCRYFYGGQKLSLMPEVYVVKMYNSLNISTSWSDSTMSVQLWIYRVSSYDTINDLDSGLSAGPRIWWLVFIRCGDCFIIWHLLYANLNHQVCINFPPTRDTL